MLNTRQRITLLTLAIAALLLAACGGRAKPPPMPAAQPPMASTPQPTATAPPPTVTRTAVPPTSTPTEGIPAGAYPEIPRITLEEAKAALDEGSAVFIDVRPAKVYETAHIRGAINILYSDIEEHLGELDKAKWIITYCN